MSKDYSNIRNEVAAKLFAKKLLSPMLGSAFPPTLTTLYPNHKESKVVIPRSQERISTSEIQTREALGNLFDINNYPTIKKG